MKDNKLQVQGNSNLHPVVSLVNKISPETVNNVINSIVEIVKVSVHLRAEEKLFLQEMEKLRQNQNHNITIMQTLTTLVIGASLNDEQKDKIIEQICRLSQS